MSRAELIASVRAEYELLEKLSGVHGVRERDKERLYNILSGDELVAATHVEVQNGSPICAKDFVLFVLSFANVQVKKGNHTTRRMKRRMGDKMKKSGNRLFFRMSDVGFAFECLLRVLANDSNTDEVETGTRVSADVLRSMRSQKEHILELFAAHLNTL